MKHISEKRITCELCKGKRRLHMIKRDKRSKLSEQYYMEACPLCEGKGYLAIITQKKVQ